MKGICLVALGLLAPAVCFAQTAADQQTSPTAVAPDATSATHPPSIAEPPHCHFTASHNAPACSETVLSFQIEPDGSVKNMTIVHSSGDTDLDRAMADCTLSRKYNPAMKDGQPIEVPWQVVIKWNKDACEGSPQN